MIWITDCRPAVYRHEMCPYLDPMRPVLLPLAMFVAVTSCAQRVPAPTVSPGELAELDARRAQHPRDPGVLSDIGVRFYQAGEYGRSRDVLAAALALDPHDFRAAVHLGLAYEGLKEVDSALAAYRGAQAMKVSRAERRTVEERLVALTRQRLTEQARRAIAEEKTLAATAPAPNSIAVLPWTYLGSNPDLKPLERGMAHLVVTDLAKLPRFTLLERERVQALTDELALAGAERVDLATAARSGRLLGAAQVLSGAIRETDAGNIRLDASVVSASTAEVRATGTTSDRLQQLFAMEKALVFDLLDRMGVVLTPAERQALSERPTANVQSFLAFSRGLAAEDRGDWGPAARFFQEATVADPSFQAARFRAATSVRQSTASRTTAARLAAVAAGRNGGGVRGAQLAAAVQNIAPSMAGRLRRTTGRAAAIRSRLAEALRQDDPSRLATTARPPTTIPRP